jgi:hypothetical protein
MKQLFTKMQNIVNKYVKHYKKDFDEDKKMILEMLEEDNDTKYERYLFWIVRRCGTNIGYKSNVPISATYSYYLKELESDEKNNRYYELDLEEQTVTYIKDPRKYLQECSSITKQ